MLLNRFVIILCRVIVPPDSCRVVAVDAGVNGAFVTSGGRSRVDHTRPSWTGVGVQGAGKLGEIRFYFSSAVRLMVTSSC
jgi:hypothetical protein